MLLPLIASARSSLPCDGHTRPGAANDMHEWELQVIKSVSAGVHSSRSNLVVDPRRQLLHSQVAREGEQQQQRACESAVASNVHGLGTFMAKVELVSRKTVQKRRAGEAAAPKLATSSCPCGCPGKRARYSVFELKGEKRQRQQQGQGRAQRLWRCECTECGGEAAARCRNKMTPRAYQRAWGLCPACWGAAAPSQGVDGPSDHGPALPRAAVARASDTRGLMAGAAGSGGPTIAKHSPDAR